MDAAGADGDVNSLISRRGLLLGAAAVSLSGCAVARGAPTRNEVIAGAGSEDAGFFLELVTRERLSLYPRWGHDPYLAQTGWPGSGRPLSDQRLAPGDELILRIWDAEETSLITASDAPFSDLSNVTVTNDGTVTLPYINTVQVGGLTAEAARERLQEQLTSITPSAQVQLSVRQGRRNSVDLLGGVANPGSYPLTERNLPLSNVISAAGGAREGLRNPQVQITRGGRVYRRPLRQVLTTPSMDALLQGGDRVLIEPDPRSFKALGAAQREEVIGFDAEKVSALRALSLMGGMADTRADPRGILVLRRYPLLDHGAPAARVVFSFDLTNADGMFSADEFLLQDGDIVMATQAPATTTARVLALLGAAIGVGRVAQNL